MTSSKWSWCHQLRNGKHRRRFN